MKRRYQQHGRDTPRHSRTFLPIRYHDYVPSVENSSPSGALSLSDSGFILLQDWGWERRSRQGVTPAENTTVEPAGGFGWLSTRAEPLKLLMPQNYHVTSIELCHNILTFSRSATHVRGYSGDCATCGVLSAGSLRMAAAGTARIPHVRSLGALNIVNFGGSPSILASTRKGFWAHGY